MAANDGGEQNAEGPEDFGDGRERIALAARWVSELGLGEKGLKSFLGQRRRIFKKYAKAAKAGDTAQTDRRMSLFWSNIQTILPAVWARTPEPVVMRRFKDADPVGRLASEVLERALRFTLDCCDFADVMANVKLDFLLSARGVAWVRYVPHYEEAEPTNGAPQDLVGEDGGLIEDAAGGEAPELERDIAWQEAVFDFVDGDDLLHNVCRTWPELRWLARISYMTRAQLVKRFGEEVGKAIPLDHGAIESEKGGDKDEQFTKAAIYEIWDKDDGQVIWISKSYEGGALDVRPDPLKLKDFFPCPRFAMGTRAPDSIVPAADFVYYESQLKEIDKVTERIGKLTDALKLVGFYASGGEEKEGLKNLFANDTNTMIPISNWQALVDKGGIKGIIEWMPLDMIATALKLSIEVRQQLIQDMYQETGIADVMRGEVDPDETATATRTKGNWGSIRVREKQKELARFTRDIVRIAAEIIAQQFEPETLAEMSNLQLFKSAEEKAAAQNYVQSYAQAAQPAQPGAPPPQPPGPPPSPQILDMLQKPTWVDVVGLLRNNTLRGFRIDVETDSTIEPDDAEEKSRQVEFTQAVADLLEKMLPLIQAQPVMLEMASAMLLQLVRKFRAGRELEDVIERTMDQLAQAAGQGGAQQPNGPNPQVDAAKAQAATTSAQADVMNAQTRQFQAQTDRQEVQTEAQLRAHEIAAENARTAAGHTADAHAQVADHAHASALQAAAERAEGRRLVHDINAPLPGGPAS